MKFSITHVLIQNFRAIESLETDLWDKTLLTGDNETSKTGLASAILWCMTGKDSEGNSTFEIVPSGKYGKVSPCVELECSVDGKPLTLKREHKAKLARDKTFKEYATVCYINGLEVGTRKFQEYISKNICDEQVFKILSNPYTFVEDCPRMAKELPWQAQRRLLMELVDSSSDEELLTGKDQWEALREPLQRYDSAQQYLAFLKQESAKLQKEVGTFEAKVQQQQENIVPLDFTEEELRAKLKEVDDHIKELDEASESKMIAETQRTAEKAKTKIQKLQRQRDQIVQEYTQEHDEFLREKASIEAEAAEARRIAEEWTAKQARYAAEVERLSSTKIKTVCEHCGQTLPLQKRGEIKREVEYRLAKGNAYIENARAKAEKAVAESNALLQSAGELKAPVYPVKELDDLQEKISKAIEEANSFATASPDAELQEERTKAAAETKKLNRGLYAIEVNKACRERIEALKRSHRKNLEAVNDCQIMEDMCREFIAYKCEAAEEEINALFQTVKFQLFEKNKSNDDIREVCNLTFNGHKYADLSASTKLVANIELLAAFQKHYGVTIPIICDNMESVTADLKTDAQVVKMYVVEERCPMCGGKSGRRTPGGTWVCQKCGNEWVKTLTIKEE